MRRRGRGTDWAGLIHEIESGLRACGRFPPSVRVDGRIKRIGAGLNHDNYLFRITADGLDKREQEQGYFLRKLGRDHGYDSDAEAVASLRTEAQTLQALAGREFEFSIPRLVCLTGNAPATPSGLVETAVTGYALDLIAKSAESRPFFIDAVARVAAAVHQLPQSDFDFLPGHADSRSHVLARLDEFPPEFLETDAEAAKAVAWVRSHLPQNRPAVVRHGDLLPQNILRDFDSDRLGVVDWEYARIGDPAYDLAIVTRGNRKLFGSDGGQATLVDTYRNAGGAAIELVDVTVHESLMLLDWLWGAVRRERAGRQEGHPPEYWRQKLRAVLRRAQGRGR